jgi:hypothetical protein
MSETLSNIIKKFEARRKEVSNDIYANIEKLSNLKTLKQAQINMLSLRQRLLEDNHTLLEHVIILKKKYRNARAYEMENISKNIQVRYQSNEKREMLDGKTSGTKEYLEVFENQVSFFYDSMKTVDSVIYGIKTRLDIEKTIGM